MNARRLLSSRSLDLSVRHLRAVSAVARYGGFTAAAADLGMTQPAVSRLVAQVEREIGLALFVRSTRRVVLTAPGRELIASLDRFVQDLDIQVENARSTGGPLRGRLIISCLLSLTHHMVPNTLLQYRRAHPGVEVHLREGIGAEVYEDVRSGLADFGIGNAVGLGAGLVAEYVCQESCLAVVPRRHRLAQCPEVSLKDFEHEPMVSLPIGSGLRQLVDSAAAAQGITLKHMTVVEQFGTLYDVVAAGLGLSIVPASALPRKLRASLRAKPIASPALMRSIGILRLRDRALTPAAQSFLEMFSPRFAGAARK